MHTWTVITGMFRMRICVVLRLVIVSAAAGAFAQRPSQPVDDSLRKGTDAIRAGRYEDAAKWFQAAVEAAPDNPSAHMELGVAELGLGRPADATDSLRKAIALHPDMQGAHLFLGIASAHMHQ